MKLFWNSGLIFRAGNKVKLKNTWKYRGHLLEYLGTGRHTISEIKWTKNLPYCDQFVKINGSFYYNTIFERA